MARTIQDLCLRSCTTASRSAPLGREEKAVICRQPTTARLVRRYFQTAASGGSASTKSIANILRRLPSALQLRPKAQDAERPHALRLHMQNLDIRAGSIHPKPDPPDAGTEHLGRKTYTRNLSENFTVIHRENRYWVSDGSTTCLADFSPSILSLSCCCANKDAASKD